MLEIRLAEKKEYMKIRCFYHSLIDRMQNMEYQPGWKKGIYPADGYLETSICKQELYVGISEDVIVSAMIVNHEGNEGYRKGNWRVKAEEKEVTVIHALGVHPDFGKRGIAKQMVRKAISIAKEKGQKAVRLDVLGGNVPAERLYKSLGFQYIGRVEMFYEDTGWTDYELFEYALRTCTEGDGKLTVENQGSFGNGSAKG